MKKFVTGEDINRNKIKMSTDQLNFRPSVYGVLIENGKVLLSRQWDGFDLPGGGFNIDETIDEALEREFFEETGLKVKRKKVITCESNFFLTPFEKKYCNCILIYCLVEKIGGELSIDNFDEHEKEYASHPEWIDINELKNLKFYNPVDNANIINKALKLIY